MLERAKQRAQAAEEEVRLDFPAADGRFLVRPFGWRAYTYWLSSPNLELRLGKSEHFPTVHVQLHSAYLHSLGVRWAVDLLELLLREDVFEVGPELVVSRIDLYADVQGLSLDLVDLRRFVGYGRHRRGFDDRQEAFTAGHRLTGFMFGRDALVARIYDKTVEIQRRGLSWLPDLWGIEVEGRPVWRIEFQYRRKVLREFGLREVDETLDSLQDLWRYATGSWLSLRVPNGHSVQRRWPVDPLWEEVRSIQVAPGTTGVVRRRIEQATLERIVQGLWGYVTSLAALRELRELEAAVNEVRCQVERYIAARDRSFVAEVARKRARHLRVLEPESARTANSRNEVDQLGEDAA
jgi:hypothetical protein